MKRLRVLSMAFLLCWPSVFLGEEMKSENAVKAAIKAPQPKDKNSKLIYIIGVGGSSQSVFRGALMDQSGSMSPNFSLTYGSFTFAGAAFIYTAKIGKKQFVLGTNYINDDSFQSSNSDYRKQRPESYEVWAQWSTGLWKNANLTLMGYQDVRAHWGQYFSTKLSQSFLKYFSVGALLGAGTLSANQYIYGESAAGGLSHIDPEVGYSQQLLPWKGTLTTSVSRPIVLQEKNQTAEYVKKVDSPVVVSVSGSWTL